MIVGEGMWTTLPLHIYQQLNDGDLYWNKSVNIQCCDSKNACAVS